MSYTNADIPRAAAFGREAENGRGSFWTKPNTGVLYGFGWHGGYGSWYSDVNAPRREFLKLHEAGYTVGQVIYSYATPIAVEVYSPVTMEFVWLYWDRSYSNTTDSRHKTHLWTLKTWARLEPMPYDATAEDIMGIVDGHTRYIPGKGYGKPGRFVAGLTPRNGR